MENLSVLSVQFLLVLNIDGKNVTVHITASMKQLTFRGENVKVSPKVKWRFTLLSPTLFSCVYVPVKSAPHSDRCFMCDQVC